MSEPSQGEATELLDRAEQQLKSGHFAAARQLLGSPLSASEPERRAKLWARLSPDPLVAWLIAACLLFFVVLVAVTA